MSDHPIKTRAPRPTKWIYGTAPPPPPISLNGERWLPVVGNVGYCVSDRGDVVSCRTTGRADRTKFMTKWRAIKATKTFHGYLFVSLYGNGKKLPIKIHKLVLEAFRGPCPDGMECRHLNGVRSDNRLVNLAWGTQLENAADQTKHGTQVRGERQGSAKLTSFKVALIRLAYAYRLFSQWTLAEMAGVSQKNVSMIVRRITWNHVSDIVDLTYLTAMKR